MMSPVKELKHAYSVPGYPGGYHPPPVEWEEVLKELNERPEGGMHPQTNMIDEKEFLRIELTIPGHQKEDFVVTISNRRLVIVVLRRMPGKKDNEYCHKEFDYGCFAHWIDLPENVDPDFASAEYRNGILIFHFPKVSYPLPNRVNQLVIY